MSGRRAKVRVSEVSLGGSTVRSTLVSILVGKRCLIDYNSVTLALYVTLLAEFQGSEPARLHMNIRTVSRMMILLNNEEMKRASVKSIVKSCAVE